ncbi:hypothetical protein A2U01_0090609, partial [Trifolium medium]|nr:hypothetical protein [Trifolium medium]
MRTESFAVKVEYCTEPLCYGGCSGGDSDVNAVSFKVLLRRFSQDDVGH